MPTSIKTIIFLPLLLIAGLALLSATLNFFVPAHEGIAIDLNNGKPIPETEVSIECHRPRGLHGTQIAGTTTEFTDQHGIFPVSMWQWFTCTYLTMRVSKDGFTQADEQEKEYGRSKYGNANIPKKVYFLKRNTDYPLLVIKSEQYALERVITYSSPKSSYQDAYERYSKSRKVATNDDHHKLIKETFCPELISRYQVLTNPEWVVKEGGNDRVIGRKYLFEHEAVVDYCK